MFLFLAPGHLLKLLALPRPWISPKKNQCFQSQFNSKLKHWHLVCIPYLIFLFNPLLFFSFFFHILFPALPKLSRDINIWKIKRILKHWCMSVLESLNKAPEGSCPPYKQSLTLSSSGRVYSSLPWTWTGLEMCFVYSICNSDLPVQAQTVLVPAAFFF